MILARTRFDGINGSWSEHPNSTVEEVADSLSSRMTEGMARPMEIVEVEVLRHVVLRTEISRTEEVEL